jgi:hypothetical protein
MWFPRKVDGVFSGTIQRWVCETDSGVVKWNVDPENLDIIWYHNFYNSDDYTKEVHIESYHSVGKTELSRLGLKTIHYSDLKRRKIKPE